MTVVRLIRFGYMGVTLEVTITNPTRPVIIAIPSGLCRSSNIMFVYTLSLILTCKQYGWIPGRSRRDRVALKHFILRGIDRYGLEKFHRSDNELRGINHKGVGAFYEA